MNQHLPPSNLRKILNRRKPNHTYFVIMQDFDRSGLEAIVHPEDTRRQIVQNLREGQYKNVQFIHYVADGLVEDVTSELMDEAEALARETV